MKEAIKSRVYRLADGQWGCAECDFTSNRTSVVSVHVEAKHLQTEGFDILMLFPPAWTR